MSDAEFDKTPWEFACSWYRPDEIGNYIARAREKHGCFRSDVLNIPTDIYSQEFADWLTEQYRLAMAKGIEIGQRRATRSDR